MPIGTIELQETDVEGHRKPLTISVLDTAAQGGYFQIYLDLAKLPGEDVLATIFSLIRTRGIPCVQNAMAQALNRGEIAATYQNGISYCVPEASVSPISKKPQVIINTVPDEPSLHRRIQEQTLHGRLANAS